MREALLLHGSDPAFCKCVQIGASGRMSQTADALWGEDVLEGGTEFSVAVMQQVTTSTDRTQGVIDSIASHLRHSNETSPSQDLNSEEVCSGEDGHVGSN